MRVPSNRIILAGSRHKVINVSQALEDFMSFNDLEILLHPVTNADKPTERSRPWLAELRSRRFHVSLFAKPDTKIEATGDLAEKAVESLEHALKATNRKIFTKHPKDNSVYKITELKKQLEKI